MAPVNVLAGGDEFGAWMTAHPGIDKLSFTGSVATGKKVMASAAVNLERLPLELGGKDAAIVLDDVDPNAIAPIGPIDSVLKFGDVDDVVPRANDTRYGLSGSVWSRTSSAS